jgi:hypothetical protein
MESYGPVLVHSTMHPPHYVIHISKSGHQKGTCFEKIGLSAQNLLTFLGSIVDINRGGGDMYVHLTNIGTHQSTHMTPT